MREKKKLAHRPFADAKRLIKKALESKVPKEEALPEALSPERSSEPQVGETDSSDEHATLGDEHLFSLEMSGVLPLDKRESYIPKHRSQSRPQHRDDDAEAMALLADLVNERTSFDLSESDEHIEGIAIGLDKRLLKRLREGRFAVQAHLDLHGKNRSEARMLVESFLVKSRQKGYRCVLIVHGRGLNSKDQIPVLKGSLKLWMVRGRIARSVLAFCSARPTDGGVGAIYVLLRK